MALMTAGHWITTDSGQHILILPGHGTTKEQVAAHFKSKGQPNHPDVGKAVVHHRGGFDPEKANRGISTRNGAEAMQVRIKGHEEAGKGKPSKPEGKAPAKEPASSKSPDTARADRLKRLNSKLPAEQTKTLRERAAELKGTKRAVEQGRAERVGSKPKEEAKPAPAETTTNRLAGAPTKSMTLRERAAMKARPKSVEAETPAAKPSMTLREKIASRKAEASKPGSESFREGRVSDRAWERGQKLRAAGKGEEAEAEFSRHDRMMRRLYHKTPEGQGEAVAAKAPAAPAGPAPRVGTPEARARLAKAIKGQRSELAEARASTVKDIDPAHIEKDTPRFQYKIDADKKTGSVGSLAGQTKWKPGRSGAMQVWKDPVDGKTYVVNGHNRLELAQRLGVKRVSVRYIDAPTAKDAMAEGALTNISEGRGTSTDAARFLRETGHSKEVFERENLPMKEKVASEGLGLAGLEPGLWKKHLGGELSSARGAVIGGSGLSHAEQENLGKMLSTKGVEKASDKTLARFIEDSRSAPTIKQTTRSLFGDTTEDVNLGLHKAGLSTHIEEALNRDKRLFGTVAKSQNVQELARAGNVINAEESGKLSDAARENLAVYRTVRKSSGPVAQLENEGALRIHNGENKANVHADILKRLPAAVAAMSTL